ncbi:MAG: glycosyltransferase family 2 protein [Bacteroidia bacterium]
MSLAPIVLFVYNRPEHTLRTLEALSRNNLAASSELFVFADGAKAGASEETLGKIRKVKEIVKSKDWCKRVQLIESEKNKGLAASVIDGVTAVIREHGKVIVLEDDLLTSPFFLNYMNDALNLYEEEDKVACISAYIYPVGETLPETFFIKGADCWGWATWSRAWSTFESDGKRLMSRLKGYEKEFDFGGTYPFTEMLEHQIEGKNDSWAIRWYASAFLEGRLCLYPGRSLVQNIGFDGSGTHGGTTSSWQVEIAAESVKLDPLPAVEDLSSKKKISSYFRSLKPSIVKKIKGKLKAIVKGN